MLRYVDALRNPEPMRASLACDMLAKLGDRRAIEPLMALVASRPIAFEVLTAAVDSLADLRAREAIPILMALLQDATAAIPARVAALRALIGFGGQTAMHASTWAKHSNRPSLQATALEAAESDGEDHGDIEQGVGYT